MRRTLWRRSGIERGLRLMLGKGYRSAAVKESMRRHGCVYLGAVEGMAALLTASPNAIERARAAGAIRQHFSWDMAAAAYRTLFAATFD